MFCWYQPPEFINETPEGRASFRLTAELILKSCQLIKTPGFSF